MVIDSDEDEQVTVASRSTRTRNARPTRANATAGTDDYIEVVPHPDAPAKDDETDEEIVGPIGSQAYALSVEIPSRSSTPQATSTATAAKNTAAPAKMLKLPPSVKSAAKKPSDISSFFTKQSAPPAKKSKPGSDDEKENEDEDEDVEMTDTPRVSARKTRAQPEPASKPRAKVVPKTQTKSQSKPQAKPKRKVILNDSDSDFKIESDNEAASDDDFKVSDASEHDDSAGGSEVESDLVSEAEEEVPKSKRSKGVSATKSKSRSVSRAASEEKEEEEESDAMSAVSEKKKTVWRKPAAKKNGERRSAMRKTGEVADISFTCVALQSRQEVSPRQPGRKLPPLLPMRATCHPCLTSPRCSGT